MTDQDGGCGHPGDDDETSAYVAELAAYLDEMTPLERERLEHAERVDAVCAGLKPDESVRHEQGTTPESR